MERHFTLPITLAATLHLAALFGFRPAHEIATRITDPLKPPPTDTMRFQILPEPQPVEENEKLTSAKREPTSPAIPERPAPDPDGKIAVVIPDRPQMDPTSEIVIHTGPPGIGEFDVDPFGPTGKPVVKAIDLDNAPRARRQVAPVYPFAAKTSGLSGDVLVEFTVDETGAVCDPRVVRSSDRGFEEAAHRAVSRWQFEPGRRAGRVVRFRMALPIVFKLDEN